MNVSFKNKYSTEKHKQIPFGIPRDVREACMTIYKQLLQ